MDIAKVHESIMASYVLAHNEATVGPKKNEKLAQYWSDIWIAADRRDDKLQQLDTLQKKYAETLMYLDATMSGEWVVCACGRIVTQRDSWTVKNPRFEWCTFCKDEPPNEKTQAQEEQARSMLI